MGAEGLIILKLVVLDLADPGEARLGLQLVHGLGQGRIRRHGNLGHNAVGGVDAERPGPIGEARQNLRHLIGAGIDAFTRGALPHGVAAGAFFVVACFIAYGSSKAKAKNKDEWGKGAIEGVAAPEAANNAVSGPSMIPLLALGVPGSTIAAMLMGVFLIHGIQVGPKIFETSGDIIYGLFAAGLIGIVLYGLIGWFLGPAIGRVIAKVPPRLIYPTILAVALISAYAARSSMFDVLIACIFGVIGYFMRTLNFSPAAAIIAFVLAPGAEQALRQSVLLTDAGFGIFLQRPVALAFFAIPLIAIGIRVVARLRAAKGSPSAQEAKQVT